MSPPFLSILFPRSFGRIGAFAIIPIRAETKLAAVRHKKDLPFNSACQLMIGLEKNINAFCKACQRMYRLKETL